MIERDAPGSCRGDARRVDRRHTPKGMLSRGVSGIAGHSLIVNFPGSPNAVRELFPVIAPVLAHAVATLRRERGQRVEH